MWRSKRLDNARAWHQKTSQNTERCHGKSHALISFAGNFHMGVKGCHNLSSAAKDLNYFLCKSPSVKIERLKQFRRAGGHTNNREIAEEVHSPTSASIIVATRNSSGNFCGCKSFVVASLSSVSSVQLSKHASNPTEHPSLATGN